MGGIDVVEVRRRNLLAAHSEPIRSVTGATCDAGKYVGALDAAPSLLAGGSSVSVRPTFPFGAHMGVVEVDHVTATSRNPLGANDIGESGTIRSTPAEQPAVVDAIGHLGARHPDRPGTPEKVWQVVSDAA